MPEIDKIKQFKREILDDISNERLTKGSLGVSIDVSPPELGENIIPWTNQNSILERDTNENSDFDSILDDLEREDKIDLSPLIDGGDTLKNDPYSKVNVDPEFKTLDDDFDVPGIDSFADDLEKVLDDNSIDINEVSNLGLNNLDYSQESDFSNFVSDQNDEDVLETNEASIVPENNNSFSSDDLDVKQNVNDMFGNVSGGMNKQLNSFIDDELISDVSNVGLDNSGFQSHNTGEADFKFLENDTKNQFNPSEFKINYPLFLKHLNSYPRNLRIAIAEALLNEDISKYKIEALIDLVEKNKKSLKFIAKFVGDAVGRSIKLPIIYFKAEESNKLQEKFSYRVSKALFPLVKIFSFFLILIIISLYLIVDVVFFYIASESKYKEGIKCIYANKRALAKDIFKEAYYLRSNDKWFINYAKAFEEIRDFDSAEEKYEELFTVKPFAMDAVDRRRKNFNKEGYVAYASMKMRLGKYLEANSILDEVISNGFYDYDALILKGDNYLKWAKIDPKYYKDSINSYTFALSKYGQNKEILFKLFNVYIDSGLDIESENVNNFIKFNGILDIDEVVYTKYIKKLIDKYVSFVIYNKRVNNLSKNLNYLNGQINLLNKEFSYFKKNDSQTVIVAKNDINMNTEIEYLLRKVLTKNPSYSTALFESGRYFYHVGDFKKAEGYLLKALSGFIKENLIDNAIDKILVYKILADIYDKSGDSLKASNIINLALSDYVFYKNHDLIRGSKELSSIYEKQGDILRSLNDFKSAISSYQLAINEGVDYPDIYYKAAILSYKESNYEEVLKYLFKVENIAGFSNNEVSNFIAITLYKMGDFLASRSYYLRVIQNLELERSNILDFKPKENDYHRNLLLKAVEVYNNLGVIEVLASFSSAANNKLFNLGISNLSESAKMFDILNRDDNMSKSVKKDLASLNLRSIFKDKFSRSNVLFYDNLVDKF